MNAVYKEIESVTFPSDLEKISFVETLIDEVYSAQNIHEDFYGNILIAVTEGVNNAIVHGNREDKSKNVHLSIQISEPSIKFIIEDEGIGFAFNNLPDPTAPENIEKESGRGVFLMKALADTVEFENQGRRIVLTFLLS